MIRFPPAGRRLAPLFCALFCLIAAPLPAADWRAAATMSDLVQNLEGWLDDHAPWPRNPVAPDVRLTSAARASALVGIGFGTRGGRRRGLYDADSATIHLVQPWNPRDPQDVSVLLHELAHHRQAVAGHWYCPGAMELPAYRLQQAWLLAEGETLRANWIAVVLEAGCTPRDIHPD